MERILGSIHALKKTAVGRLVRTRMMEFLRKGAADEEQIFKELCFCLLTANYSAEGGVRIQEKIGDGFINMPEKRLALELKRLGYRFPNIRARYVVEARKHFGNLKLMLASSEDEAELREWLADNVLGLGYKEASHFLRNTGCRNLAIIDFHIIDLLAKHRIITKPKSRSLPRKRYLEIERVLSEIAGRSGISQGELDLYLWYMETGKILK